MAQVKAPRRLTMDTLQQAAAESHEGPIVLHGGPGTGKTHTMLIRIALLLKGNASPHSITYLTLSSRSAEEMRQLLAQQPETAEAAQHIFVGTMHHYASHFLRRDGAKILGISPQFSIWDHQQALDIITQNMDYEFEKNKERKVDPNTTIPKLGTKEVMQILNWHSLNQSRNPLQLLAPEDSSWFRVIDFYTKEKLRQNVLDLDDLVPMAIQAMNQDPNVQAMWRRSRSLHMLIDGFEDITYTQHEMLKLMTGPTKSIMISAEPNQSINQWKGADPTAISHFENSHPSRNTHMLRVNHRATGYLTEMATHMTEHKIMTGLTYDYEGPIRKAGERPQLREYTGNIQFMDEQILKMAQGLNREGIPWEDMACIYRKGSTIARMRNMVTRANIPHTVLGETQKQRDSDTTCMTNLMALALNPKDLKAFSIAASTDIKSRNRKLNLEASKDLAVLSRERDIDLIEAAEEYLKNFALGTNIQKQLLYVTRACRELNQLMDDPETTLYAICKRAQRLMQEDQRHGPVPIVEPQVAKMLSLSETTPRMQAESVRQHLARFIELLTTALYPEHRSLENDDPFAHHTGLTFSNVHIAKGKQWKIVWFIDVNDHVIPGFSEEKSAIEEEQRIFYVASTRATDQLYYCYSTHIGRGFEPQPSRFIDAVDEYVDHILIKNPDEPPQNPDTDQKNGNHNAGG